MSYNISQWKTKKLENLVIPLKAFYEHPREDWHPELIVTDMEAHDVELSCGCEQTIKGNLKDNLLTVTKFEMRGEGSGTFYSWILEGALQQSTGILEAVLIWERGDSITRLTVNDGVLKTEPIEL